FSRDWSSDVCSSDLVAAIEAIVPIVAHHEVMAVRDGAAYAVLHVLAVSAVREVDNGHKTLRSLLIKQNTVLGVAELFSIAPHVRGTIRLVKVTGPSMWHLLAIYI